MDDDGKPALFEIVVHGRPSAVEYKSCFGLSPRPRPNIQCGVAERWLNDRKGRWRSAVAPRRLSAGTPRCGADSAAAVPTSINTYARGQLQPGHRVDYFGTASGNRRHLHRHSHLMFAAAGDDAAQGTDVAVVAAVSDGDVVLGGQEIVCRVEVHPTEVGTVHREPRVGSVRSHKAFLAFHRVSAQVAAHVTRGQAERAQAS